MAHILGVECVNVLVGANSVYNGIFVYLLGKRELDQNAVYSVVIVELFNQRQKLCLRGLFGKSILKGLKAHLCARLFLVVHIYSGSRVITYDNNCQSNGNALCFKLLGLSLYSCLYLCGNCLAVNEICHDFSSLKLFFAIFLRTVLRLVGNYLLVVSKLIFLLFLCLAAVLLSLLCLFGFCDKAL